MAGTSLSTFWDIEGLAADPPVSAANSSRIYYNTVAQQLKISTNGGAYQYMLADALWWSSNAITIGDFMVPYQPGIAGGAATEIQGTIPAQRAGHLAGMFVKALDANFSANGNVTLRKNGVNTALVATFTNAVNSASDDTDIVAVAQGDLISIQCSVTLTNNPMWCSVLWLP